MDVVGGLILLGILQDACQAVPETQKPETSQKLPETPVPGAILQNLTIFGIWVGGASVVVKARDSNRFAASRFRGFYSVNREGLHWRPDFIGDFARCRSGLPINRKTFKVSNVLFPTDSQDVQ